MNSVNFAPRKWVCLQCGLIAAVLAACAPSPAATAEPTEAPPTETALTIEAATETEALIVAPTEAPTATPTPQPEGPFVPASNNPVFNASKPGLLYVDPGAVIVADGTFHAFTNYGTGLNQDVHHATSSDGIIWEAVGDDKNVLSVADTGYIWLAMPTTGLIQDDGTWVMYFYGWKDQKPFEELDNYSTIIGRATSPGPDGPWTPDPEPVLKPGGSGAWDAHQIKHSTVVKTPEGYALFYTGITRSGEQAIGMANSTDGVHFTKYDDPATTDDKYAQSDPVLTAEASLAWDDTAVFQPSVQLTPDGWVMIFKGSGSAGDPDSLGLALSDDGIHWTRSDDNPILRPDAFKGGRVIWLANLQYVAGTYFLFIELSRSANGSKSAIYLATHEGSLK